MHFVCPVSFKLRPELPDLSSINSQTEAQKILLPIVSTNKIPQIRLFTMISPLAGFILRFYYTFLVSFILALGFSSCYIFISQLSSVLTQEGESATIPTSTSTPANMSKKKRIRAGYRGYVTKLISDSRDLLGKGPFSGSEAENLKAHLRERQTLLRNFDNRIICGYMCLQGYRA